MFTYSTDLSEKANSWMKELPEIFSWLTATPFDGFWFCDLDDFEKYYISPAFQHKYAFLVNSEEIKKLLARFPQDLSEFHEELNILRNTGQIVLHVHGKVFNSDTKKCLFIKFEPISEASEKEENLRLEVHKLSRLNKLLFETNKVARIGGWEVNLIENTIYWSELTRDIHEVDDHYIPDIAAGLNFYKEGWSREKITKLFNAAVLENKAFDSELKIVTAKGNELWVRSFGTPEFVNGKCVRVFGAFQDIDKRKKSEQELEGTRKRFEMIFDNSSIGILLMNSSGKILLANPASLNIFGFEHENRSKPLETNFEELIHQDFQIIASNKRKELLNREIKSYQMEAKFQKISGERIWCRLNTSILHSKNTEESLIITQVEDITINIKSQRDLRKSLQELQNLMNATTQVSIIETNTEGIPRKFNKGAENLLGYNAEEFIGKKDIRIIHDPNEVMRRGEELSTLYNQEIDGFDVFIYRARLGQFDSNEWTYIRKDGSKLQVQLVVTAITNEKGKINGYLGVATDISQRKKMESRLLLAKKKAESANRAKSDFLANMSHEIRTPLNGILGFTDLLMRSQMADSQKQYLNTIYNSGISLKDIINDILDFSKIEAGKLKLDSEKVNVIQLASQAIDIIKHEANKKNLEVLLNISPDVFPYIIADPLRLKQILINLLGNAVKFTEKGEIEVKIETLKQITEDYFEYQFSIRDTGIGIAPNNLQKIFRAFDQEDASTTRRYGGSGLGLSISNRLLHLMESELKVNSELNTGSTFSFDITFQVASNENNRIIHHFKKIQKVLIVDDNASNRLLLQQMLQYHHIESISSANAIKALDQIKKNDFDLAIIDYKMPFLTGVQLGEQIRNTLKINKEKLPIILLHTSGQDEIILEACKKYDIEYRLSKPILRNELIKILDEIEGSITSEDKHVQVEKLSLENLHDIKILLVEDNPVNKLLANTILKEIVPQAVIIEAENGIEAIDAFKVHNFDLILMDIQMPILSGYKAAEHIRKLEGSQKHTPIIALTARTIDNEKEKCLKHGMDDYLSKPVLINDVRDMLKKFIVNK